MNDRGRVRQFWLRLHLSVGMLWGFLPFISLPFFWDAAGTGINRVLPGFDCLTVFPACVAGFWHRRVAAVLLGLNGLGLLWVLQSALRTVQPMSVISATVTLVPVYLAAALGWMEWKRWPPAIGDRTSEPA